MGALGCEITMSGKLKGPRGRMEKMVEGYIKHCGAVAGEIVDKGYAIAQKKPGVIGVKVKIVKPGVKIPDDFHIKVVTKEVEKEESKKEGEKAAAAEAAGAEEKEAKEAEKEEKERKE